jgi:AcrR family transcriptional regulator
MHDMKVTESRTYRMRARAENAEQTANRILAAAVELFWERPTTELSLDAVAERAGVSTRTVIRRFGGKDQLLVAAGDWDRRRVTDQRDRAPVGDVVMAVEVLVEHYEELGEKVLRLLAAQATMPALSPLVDQGRQVHRRWCRRVFAPYLEGLSASERRRRLAQYVAVCDVYTWKLLRLDSGLSRRQTQTALVEILIPLTKES